MEIYLDNSATTRVCQLAADKMRQVMTEIYGNPSSLHHIGFQAELEIKTAKQILVDILGCKPGEIVFTSGGTEANNLAVMGAAYAYKRRGNKIVTTQLEHSSVLSAAAFLETQGFEIIRVAPQADGTVSAQSVADAVDDKTILVSAMLVNNETGTVLPVAQIAELCRRKNPNIIVHCDAVQAFCKLPIRVTRLGTDLLTISGHKIHAPKGIGALYIKKGIRLKPMLFGGEQQDKIRPGTENVPAIAALGVAAHLQSAAMSENNASVRKLNDLLRKRLSAMEGVTINSPADACPYILNLSVDSIRSETLLHFLEQEGIYVSSGSACARGAKSHVLSAMGLSSDAVDSAIRISFSGENTMEDVEALLNALQKGMAQLQRRK